MKVIQWLDENFEEMTLFVLLCLMTLIMGIQIVARYVFNNSFSWTEELTRYLFIVSGFLSISYCIKKEISIRITQFAEALSKGFRTILELTGDMIQLIFYIYLIPFGYKYWQNAIASGQKSTGLGLPMYVMQIVPMICFILAVIRLIQHMVIEVQRYRKGGQA